MFRRRAGGDARWHDAGLGVAIYSSGSELAQRRLFESTGHGDLDAALRRFFDTRVGAKIETAATRTSPRRSAASRATMLFISDVAPSSTAAQHAGMQILLSRRPGNPPQPVHADLPSVSSFDEFR